MQTDEGQQSSQEQRKHLGLNQAIVTCDRIITAHKANRKEGEADDSRLESAGAAQRGTRLRLAPSHIAPNTA